MTEMKPPSWTAAEKALSDAWDQHLGHEFAAHDPDGAIDTMVEVPRVHLVPVMIGGEGRAGVHEFYAKRLLPHVPPDLTMVPVSRTIGQGRLVDEVLASFTHTVQMDWMLPGIAPTGKRVEVGLIMVVQFEGTKLVHEHLYWDQASVLVQLGLLNPAGLPVVGAEGTHAITDRSLPLNGLIKARDR